MQMKETISASLLPLKLVIQITFCLNYKMNNTLLPDFFKKGRLEKVVQAG